MGVRVFLQNDKAERASKIAEREGLTLSQWVNVIVDAELYAQERTEPDGDPVCQPPSPLDIFPR
jgi:hypothetical protein